MGTRDDGGSAFPRNSEWETQKGMTLRDWFAGQALAGVMVNAHGIGSLEPTERAETLRQAAGLIYEMADAMLAARED